MALTYSGKPEPGQQEEYCTQADVCHFHHYKTILKIIYRYQYRFFYKICYPTYKYTIQVKHIPIKTLYHSSNIQKA